MGFLSSISSGLQDAWRWNFDIAADMATNGGYSNFQGQQQTNAMNRQIAQDQNNNPTKTEVQY